jgi:hypothetical protein
MGAESGCLVIYLSNRALLYSRDLRRKLVFDFFFA